MALGLIGRKCGMTRVFSENGAATPVTVVKVDPTTVVQVKTDATDGYSAIQVTTGTTKRSKLTKPLENHYAKADVHAGRGLWEFRLDEKSQTDLAVGSVLDVTLFEQGQYVDVQGITKGKGFAGAVKRHHFRTQDATHGNSLSHRAPGSIGQNQSPGRVFKGKKMAGHLGNDRRTVQNLQIFGIDKDKSLLFVKGAIPGHSGNDVIILPAIKRRSAK
jgi:large subunit ribosomal protein L3